jgi:hypothetical protein
MGLKVRATKMVYYGLKRRKPGEKSELFEIKSEAEFTPSCMEPVGWKTKAMIEAEKQAPVEPVVPPPTAEGSDESGAGEEEVI